MPDALYCIRYPDEVAGMKITEVTTKTFLHRTTGSHDAPAIRFADLRTMCSSRC